MYNHQFSIGYFLFSSVSLFFCYPPYIVQNKEQLRDGSMGVTVPNVENWSMQLVSRSMDRDGKGHGAWVVPEPFCGMRFFEKLVVYLDRNWPKFKVYTLKQWGSGTSR